MVCRILTIFLTSLSALFTAQQNEEFKSVMQYFDHHREMMNSEFHKRFDKEPSIFNKSVIKKDFQMFLSKLDSIQNHALIGALIKVKNREDLQKIRTQELPELKIMPFQKNSEKLSTVAEYPGGINAMRQQLVNLFYAAAVKADQKMVKSEVVFVVEKDGSISSVHSFGDNFTFNRQAEIAMYMLPSKFSPAKYEGQNVRYRFRLPLRMDVE